MGFSIRWRWLVLCGFRDGDRVKPGVAKVECQGGKGRSLSGTRIWGGIFTDHYFGEANTANNSDNHHNNAINKKINWGGISGQLQLATTNRGSRPEIQDDPGGGEGERSQSDDLNNTKKELCSIPTTNFGREAF